MIPPVFYIIIGYLSGSVLFANVYCRLFGKERAADRSRDGNPGTANAYVYGGFLVGTLTLISDLAKGIIPVMLYTYGKTSAGLASDVWLPLVLAAPVIGHIFPVFYGFSGGKGIAVTFGCLLGLAPYMMPALTLAFFFIFFSLILRIKSHFHRTAVTYLVTSLALFPLGVHVTVFAGFLIITAAVILKLHQSREERQKFEVKLLWMH